MLLRLIVIFLLLIVGSDSAKLRVAHAAPKTAVVDVLANGSVLFSSVPYENVTQFKTVSAGTYQIVVQTGNQTLFNDSVVIGNDLYTFAAINVLNSSNGISTNLTLLPLVDVNSAPDASTNSLIRFAHLSPSAPAVDVNVCGKKIISNVSYQEVALYVEVPAAACLVEILVSQSSAVVLSINQTFTAGSVYSIFAEGIVGDVQTPLTAILLVDANFQYFNLRVAHASPDAGAVNVSLYDSFNKTVASFNVFFGQSSLYSVVAAQNYTIQIGNFYQFVDASGEAAGSYLTAAVVGQVKTGKLEIVLVADDLSPPVNGSLARIQFFHASPDVPPVDIKANGVTIFSNIAYKEYSSALVNPAVYLVQVFESGSTVILYNATLQVTGGWVVSIYAEGLSAVNSTVPFSVLVTVEEQYNYFQVKFSHSSPEAPAINVTVQTQFSTKTIVSSLAFKQFSSYLVLPLIPSVFRVVPVSSPNLVVLTFNLTGVSVSSLNTVFIIGTLSAPDYPLNYISLQDNNTAQSSTEAKVRFIHASPFAPNVNIVLNGELAFGNVAYGTAVSPVVVYGNTYNVEVVPVNGSPVLKTFLTVAGGQIVSVIAEDFPANLTLVSNVDASYDYFSVRALHAAPDVGPVDIYVDSILVFSNVAFGTNATFYKVLSKTDVNGSFLNYNFSISPFGSSVTIYSFVVPTSSIPVGQLLTAAIVGLSSNNTLKPVILYDENNGFSINASVARFRVFHASPNAPAVNVKANGAIIFANVSYTQATLYVSVPAGTYFVQITLASNDLEVVLAQNLTLRGGQFYSIYAENLAATLSLFVNYDAQYVYFNLKGVHLVSDANPVQIFFDTFGFSGPLIFSNISYANVNSPYSLSIPSGNYTVRVVSGNQIVYVYNLVSPASGNYTFALIGTLKANISVSSLLFPNDDSPPADDLFVKIRVVHAYPIANSVNVIVDQVSDPILVPGITYGTVSNYVGTPVGTNLSIAVYREGSFGSPLYFNSVTWIPGTVYTIYAAPLSSPFSPLNLFISNDSSVSFIRIRFSHANPDVGPVNIYVDGNLTVQNLNYTQSSATYPFVAGANKIRVTYSPSSNDLFTLANNYGSFVTAVLAPVNSSLQLLPYSFGVNSPQLGSLNLRFIHLVSDAPSVIVRISYDIETFSFPAISFTEASNYERFPSGTKLSISVFAGDVAIYSTNVNLTDGIYSVLIEGKDYLKSFTAVLITDFTPLIGQVRVINAASLNGSVDVFFDNVQSSPLRFLWTNLTFGSTNGVFYKSVRTSSYVVSVAKNQNIIPSFNLSSSLVRVLPEQFFTYFLVGDAVKPGAFYLIDNNTLPGENQAKIRFVHASPDAGTVTILLNDKPTFVNVTFQNFSYVTVDQALYQISILSQNGTKMMVNAEPPQLDANSPAVYTIVAEGYVNASSGQESFRFLTVQDTPNASPPVSPTNPPDSSPSGGLSPAIIALIVIACVVGVVIIAGLIFIVYKRRNRVGYEKIDQ